ncbi:YadA-like family protein [Burkholderia contaminans]|uniref:YadA-like family protein n=1 Tax=Burkholderia contaminans TaxID=488447 RepID=UPI002D7F7953|nr:YadA-like family protein [Burkholderia contaminans]MEB4663013.1 YadA-like family protein [Burkholderia contaminans]MEB4716437.1 YadA-like family protein [Burkholderia contaminans]
MIVRLCSCDFSECTFRISFRKAVSVELLITALAESPYRYGYLKPMRASRRGLPKEKVRMNKSYRVVWNASTSTWCAASEIARGRSKSSRSAKSKIAAATALVVASMGSAYADESEPVDPTVDDPVRVSEAKPSDPEILKRDVPTTRIVVPDTKAYVQINTREGSSGASALGEESIAIGSGASTRPGTSALGGAVAVGNRAAAVGDGVALGANAAATGDLGSLALGSGSSATGTSSIAVGYGSRASGSGAYALGRTSEASALSALAIGESARATREGTTAIGYQTVVDADDALALGAYSEAHRNQTVSVGTAGFERQIVNVGRGTQATDAVNIAQLKDVTATLGGDATVDANGNIKKPAYTIGSKTYDNVGDALKAASASGGGSENAVEYDSTAKNSVTLGGTDAAAVKLTNVRAATLSSNSTDAVNGAQLFATNNRVTKVEQSLNDSGLIDPSTGESLAVVYRDATKSTVALGGTGGTTITNVKAGKVTSTSKDAVNGGQLYDVSSSVASALGGQSAVNADGTVSTPTYKVGDKTYNNVGDALQAAASSGGAGGDDTNAVHYDSTSKSSVTLGGTGATKPVSLKNVATGTAATDAVNVAQLQGGLSDVKDEIKKDLGDGTLDMKYIKVRATGMQASALGKNSVAIGSQASATNVDTLAIGSGARASGVGSVAIGVNSVATGANTVSIGDVGATRRIVNVSDGVDETDAVTMKQLTDAMHTANTKFDTKMTRMTRDVESKPGSFIAIEGLGADGSIANIASMNGRDPKLGTAAAIGVAAGAGGLNAVAVGLQAVASSDNAVAIGSIAQTGVDHPYSVAIGSNVTTNGAGALAIGSRAKANAENAVALGNNKVAAVGKSSIAIGDAAMTAAGTVNSVAMGKSANIAQNVTDAIALGANASVASGNNGGIALGANSVADRGNALSVGSNSLQRQIVNVAKGTKNNDAVNVSQLTGVTNALGGGAGIETDGTVKAPTYKVGDTTYNNVGDALDAMAKNGGSDPNAVAYDSATKDKVTLAGTTGTTLSNVAAGKADMDAVNVSQLKSSGLIGEDGKSLAAITYDKNADGTPNYKSATLAGEGGTKLTNVKAAELSATSTDAVNGSQLFATNENLGNLKDALTDGGVLDKTTGESLAVVYDSTSKDKVTLAGKTGTTLSNVKAGTADLDAVNVSQLKSSGLIGEDGKSIAAVTYDKKADGTANYNSVTLGGGKSTGPVTLSNVAQGKANTDAVNVEQLTKAISEVEGGMNPLAVSYDTVAKDKVTLAGGKTGTTLSNVAAGKADTDAVNVSQLKSSGLVGEDGKSLAAITYDKNADGTPNYKSATLAGEGGTKLTNVKAAELSATSTDAVNGSQLFATNENLGNLKDALTDGGVLDKTTGESLAVVYDSTSKDKVTLAGKTGTTLSNVKAGTADLDAVNVSQLKSSGLIGEDGKSIAAVTYDKKADGTANYNSVTLGGGKSTSPVTLSNVAQGKAGTDAVNVDQLTKAISDVEGGMNPLAVSYDTVAKDKVTLTGEKGTTLTNLNAGKVSADSKDAVNGSQLYGTAKSVADALGGGSTVDENGKVKAPTYTLVDPADDTKKVDYHTVGDALENLDGRVASNTGDITNIKNQFTNTGLVDSDGDTRAAVTYDKNTDGTPNYKSATLAGKGGTKLTNVAAGTADMDAVNVSQLKSSGLVGEDGKSLAAITYDKNADGTPNYKSATLAGEGGTKLTNVKAAELSATSTDAVNGSQLFATNENLGNLKDALTDGGVLDKTTGESLAVVYDSTSKDKVTLAGKTGTTLSNVAAGKADLDAVNVSQLKSSGLIGEDGKSIAAVTYDKKTDGTPNYNSVTLGGGKSTSPVTLSNVAKGKAGTDAVNVDQLTDALRDVEGGMNPLAVAYDSAKKDKVTLTGEGGTTLSNVAAGKADTDAVNVSQLKSSGLVGEDGKSLAAITYDKNADGTPNYKSATLAGKGGTKLSNVKAGTADLDAVNVSQLKSSGLIGEDGKTLAAITYDKNADGTPNYKSATLAGEGGTTLSNVKAGKADMDAVNVAQLKSSGLVGEDGKSRAAVTYDKNADGTPNYKSATLAGVGGTTLSNVKAGTADMDAVNVSQLKSSGLIGEDGKTLAAITYDKKADGTPNYKSATLAGEGGTKLSNVAAGTADADAVNVSQLKSSGLIGEDGKSVAAVTYDKKADGTPNYKSATLAGEGGTTLANVAAGKADRDAVNVSQLKSSGLIGDDGKSVAAVTYDKNADGTPNFKSATLAGEGGTTLANVAAGKADRDAVNVSQLKSSGLIGDDGKSVAAVTYDKNADGTPNYKSATLAGVGGTTLSNVADGKADKDAVNVSQLKSSGLIGEDGKSIAAVTYDKNADGTPNYKSATLAGDGGTKLSNVAAGKADLDAVNVSQLKSSGLIGEDGKSITAVTYDKNTDGTANRESVTLAGKSGTKLTNVKAAELSATSTDAVNGSQLFATNESLGDLKDALKDGGVIDETTGESLAVVYDSTSKDKVTLAGGKTGTTLSNVKAGTADLDAVNVSQLKSSGLIGEDGKSIAAVTYDKNADGTPNYNSVTLGGGKSTGPVTLSNVAKGTAGTDAVNVDQLNDLEDSLLNGSIKLKYIKVNSEGGREAIASVPESVAIGANAWATRPGTLALGSGSRANGLNSVAIGSNSVADDDNTVAVGNVGEERRVVHVAAGVDDTDAVNVKQLTEAMHSANTKLDAKMTRMVRDVESKPGSFVAIEGLGADGSMPNIASMNGRDPKMGTAAAIGVGSGASGINSIAVGLQAVSNSDHSVAIGSIAQTGVEQPYAVAIGSMVTTNGAGALAIGSRARANAENAVAVGNNKVTAVGKSSIAIGDAATTKSGTVNSIAIGTNATVQQNVVDAIAFGANSQALRSNSIALGANSIADRANALSIGTAGAERQIVHVAKGTQNTDAVSLAQLKGLADVVGGGTGFDANGDVTAPTYTIDGKEYHNVNDALQAAAKSGNDGGNGTDPNAVAYDGAQKDKVTLAGQNGTTLSNVAAGKADTDAVNVSQLKSSGLIDKDGNAVAAMTYDKNADGTPNFKSATLTGEGGTKLSNVAAGTADMDAVNVSQLKSSGLIGDDGKSIAAVTYDRKADGTTNYGSVSLGGGKSADPVTLSNVAKGKAGTDAVNVDQLTDAIRDVEGGMNPLAVAYDAVSKDKATLAGQSGTTLSNVKAGTADMDAVNVSQLKSSGLIGENGKALAAVTYDTRADGTTNFASVTFGGVNAGAPVALHNVAAGTASTDAVNVSQLKGVTDIIGGGAGLDADGKVTAPVYNVDGKDYASVGDAIKALEQREGGNGNGTNPNAVVYDNSTKEAVTLTGANGTVLRNVADGLLAENSTEAVNGRQVNFLAQSIADSLGGGAKFDPVTGDISAPTYELTAADGMTDTYDNVGDAFKHIDERVSTHTTQIETLQKGVANAVQYDDATHASVTLGGAGAAPVTLKNVADGVDETDGVNVRQLRSAGLVGEDGKLQSAVVYDKNADGTTNYGSVTLGGAGAAAPVALHNVAAGKVATDAVNVSQLSGVTDALGGGAKIDEETGKVVAPTYNVGGDSFHNAGDALNNIDNRVTQIQNNLGEATKLVGAVAYDKNGDGTVNFNKVTLGNGLSSGPVVLTNVADGKSQYDAVNYGQLSKLEGRVNDIDDRLTVATTPGDGNGNNGGSKNANDLIQGTGGSGKDKADVVAAKPGNGNGNIAVGSSSQIVDGKNNGTAIGAGSKVSADDGTALGHGASVSSSATNSVALGSGSKATEANTVSIGSDGHERRLVNVADAVNKTDAVNKGQLDRAIGGMQGQINDMSRNAYSGIAAATALTMIPGVDPGKTLSFGVAGASYKGYQAVAMGGEARITENLKMRAGVGLSSGGNTFGMGASYQW